MIVPTNLPRPVIYWLDDTSGLRPHVGRTVDVSGTIKDVREREADVRADAARNGGVIVELEGPGRDVEASGDAIPGVVGTSGTVPASDVKTVVLEIDVAAVTPRPGGCRVRQLSGCELRQVRKLSRPQSLNGRMSLTVWVSRPARNRSAIPG